MIVKAKYDGEPCYLNTNYVVDIFPNGKYYTAYVLDVERKGYTISKEVLDEIIKAESEE